MKDYSEMSDFEINVDVSLELFEGSSGGDTSRVATWCACKEGGEYGLFDPCNNPADAWPIITENRITLVAPMSYDSPQYWMAYPARDSDISPTDEKPLRAAMIVYLQMMEQKS